MNRVVEPGHAPAPKNLAASGPGDAYRSDMNNSGGYHGEADGR